MVDSNTYGSRNGGRQFFTNQSSIKTKRPGDKGDINRARGFTGILNLQNPIS